MYVPELVPQALGILFGLGKGGRSNEAPVPLTDGEAPRVSTDRADFSKFHVDR